MTAVRVVASARHRSPSSAWMRCSSHHNTRAHYFPKFGLSRQHIDDTSSQLANHSLRRDAKHDRRGETATTMEGP